MIVNDGSSDESSAIIDRFAACDSRIRAIHSPNAGLVPSLNHILDEARGTLIARMDGDDIALPERFARQVAFLDAHPDIGVIGTGCTVIGEDSKPGPHRFDNVVSPEDIVEDLKNGPPLAHPTVLMRRDAVRAVGGYRAAYRHCEDYDLWLRLSEHVRMANLPDRLLLYRQSASQVSSRHRLTQATGAAIAWEAHLERSAGRADPTERLDVLPPIEALDALFGRAGVTTAVRARVARNIVYSPQVLRGPGFALLLDAVRDGATAGLWRTLARLALHRNPIGAARLALALALR